MAKKRLGIDVLFARTTVPESQSPGVRKILLTQIVPNPQQPRRYIDPTALAALVASIKQIGILQPIILRETAQAAQPYEIVAGERRWQAAQLAGLTEIPALVRTLSDEEAFQIALIENLQREELNPVEEAEGYLMLLQMELQPCEEFAAFQRPDDADPYGAVVRLLFTLNNYYNRPPKESSTLASSDTVALATTTEPLNNNVVLNLLPIVEKIFASIGRTNWRSFLQHRLPLRKLPTEVLAMLRTGQLEYTKARMLGRVTAQYLGSSEGEAVNCRRQLLQRVVTENLSLSELKQAIAALKPSPANSDNTTTTQLANLLQNTTTSLQTLSLETISPQYQQKLEQKLAELHQLLEKAAKRKTAKV